MTIIDPFEGDKTRKFNPGIIQWNGSLLLAYRKHGDTIWFTELSADLEPDNNDKQLILRNKFAGIEDPRLMWFNDQLLCYFTAVISEHNYLMMVAELDSETLQVIASYPLHWSRSKGCEKNWQLFEHQEKLYAVYSIQPHIVLLVGNKGKCELVAQNPLAAIPWEYGELRGGTPPVLIGDKYFSFFHSFVRDKIASRTYFAGCYGFENKFPFKVVSCSRSPILAANPYERRYDKRAVVFPCGAVFEDGNWTISYGLHDFASRICVISHDKIAAEMEVIC